MDMNAIKAAGKVSLSPAAFSMPTASRTAAWS
jgi:hypothetical protein